LSQLCNGSIYANDNDSFFGPKARSIHGELFGSENPKLDIGLRTQHLESSPEGMSFHLLSGNKEMGIHHLSFWGVHNLDNTLAALSLCMGLGHTLDELLPHLAQLQLPKGRLQEVSCRQQGKVYIDYAHTPDALQAVLKSVRTHCPKANIRLLFGCGGNRDKDKRKEMGRIASQWADALILTSDNPRYEDPKSILKDIEQGVKQNTNYDMIPDRREAILWALSSQSENDILLLCGKGHETEQSLGETSLPFDEFEICQNY
jgi:UDP-N-acetylmuramoyl-L-alanyl-D-glutamate--2,6-diaminopimelate ligase